MIKTIHKYGLKFQEFSVEIPKNAQILKVGAIPKPVMWVLLDPFAEKERREFYLAMTGEKFDASDYTYIDSGWTTDIFVFHLFERQLGPSG